MTEPASAVLLLLLFLAAKHLIADFMLQSQYMLTNRRHYGHPGGLLHVAIHVAGTGIVLVLWGVPTGTLMQMLIVEALVHYHLDWAKDRLVLHYGLTADKRGYWIAFGADQFAHHATYIGLAAWWVALAG